MLPLYIQAGKRTGHCGAVCPKGLKMHCNEQIVCANSVARVNCNAEAQRVNKAKGDMQHMLGKH